MPNICCVPMCRQVGGHHFPKPEQTDDEGRSLREQWLAAVKRKASSGCPRYLQVCHRHFKQSDYLGVYTTDGLLRQKRRLKKSAVPSIFPWSKPCSPAMHSMEERKRKYNQASLLDPEMLNRIKKHVTMKGSDLSVAASDALGPEKKEVKTEIIPQNYNYAKVIGKLLEEAEKRNEEGPAQENKEKAAVSQEPFSPLLSLHQDTFWQDENPKRAEKKMSHVKILSTGSSQNSSRGEEASCSSKEFPIKARLPLALSPGSSLLCTGQMTCSACNMRLFVSCQGQGHGLIILPSVTDACKDDTTKNEDFQIENGTIERKSDFSSQKESEENEDSKGRISTQNNREEGTSSNSKKSPIKARLPLAPIPGSSLLCTGQNICSACNVRLFVSCQGQGHALIILPSATDACKSVKGQSSRNSNIVPKQKNDEAHIQSASSREVFQATENKIDKGVAGSQCSYSTKLVIAGESKDSPNQEKSDGATQTETKEMCVGMCLLRLFRKRRKTMLKRGRLLHCELCNANLISGGFYLSKHLKNHVLPKKNHVLPKRRPYQCETCGKSFAFMRMLKYHQSIHTGFRRFICHICGKTFIRNDHLKRHMHCHIRTENSASNSVIKTSCK